MDFLIITLLAILGAALVAGGAALYRGSARPGVKAFAAAAIGSGIMMWAVILYITPMTGVRGG